MICSKNMLEKFPEDWTNLQLQPVTLAPRREQILPIDFTGSTLKDAGKEIAEPSSSQNDWNFYKLDENSRSFRK